MNRDVERAAAKLARACNESWSCSPLTSSDGDDGPECDVPVLAEAATELLEELRRAGIIPAAL